MKAMEESSPCPFCGLLAQKLMNSKRISYEQYDEILKQAIELEKQGMLELVAGDCPLEKTDEELASERHYTVCHYLRCSSCKAIYFLGACVRGRPVFRKVEDLSKENLPFRLWGRQGSYFANQNF